MNHLVENISNAFESPDHVKDSFLKFFKENKENFNSRLNTHGHITCSMLVLNEEMDKVLLTHHKKFKMWLQLGGHWDNINESALETALRETSEEGYGEKNIICELFLNKQPLDLDAHHVEDPTESHMHYDICFACIVKEEYEVNVSHESHDVKWFNVNELIESSTNHRMVRLLKKSMRMLKKTESIQVII
jgi:8-oxo-dGTP pyrophosphatase MutT (NUDIX family)